MATVGRELLFFFGVAVLGEGGCAIRGACWCMCRYFAQVRNCLLGGCSGEVCLRLYKQVRKGVHF